MSLLLAELLKLRRSSVWLVVVLLPVLAVVSGTVNYLANQETLSAGWQSYTSQVLVFYSLFFCAMGVSLLAATVWRPEHRGTSWNAMRTTGNAPWRVAAAKTLAASLPLAAMQLVVLALAWVVGAVLGLGPVVPAAFVAECLLVVLAAQPLLAFQSLLSMRMRSFAAPVAVCFLGVVVGMGLVASGSPLARLWPTSLVTVCLTLDSSAVSTSGHLDAAGILPVLLGALGCGAVCWGLLGVVAQRTGGVR